MSLFFKVCALALTFTCQNLCAATNAQLAEPPGLVPVLTQRKSENQTSFLRILNTVSDLRKIARHSSDAYLLAGYHRAGDGGGGVFFAALDDNTSTDNGGTVIVSSDQTRWKRLRSVYDDVRQFGARGDGTSDDTTAFTAALAASLVVHIPPGSFRILGNLELSKNGAKLRGAGPTASTLTVTTPNKVGISIKGSVNNIEISGFTLTRSVLAVNGAYGIDASRVTIGQSIVRDMVVENHFRNIGLGSTDQSIIKDTISQFAVDDGVHMTNAQADGASQWTIDNVLSQKNGRNGFMFKGTDGPTHISVGPWRNISTYANAGHGVAVMGSASTPVHGIRILGGFFGEDGNSEIFIDSYGGQHQISNSLVELAGRTKTGPKLDIPASNLGSGVEVTKSNVSILLNGVQSNGNSFDGFNLASALSVVGNCTGTNNGLSKASGKQNGIHSTAGRLIVNGGAFGGTSVSTTQQFGVYVSDDELLKPNSADLTNNRTAPIGFAKTRQRAGAPASHVGP